MERRRKRPQLSKLSSVPATALARRAAVPAHRRPPANHEGDRRRTTPCASQPQRKQAASQPKRTCASGAPGHDAHACRPHAVSECGGIRHARPKTAPTERLAGRRMAAPPKKAETVLSGRKSFARSLLARTARLEGARGAATAKLPAGNETAEGTDCPAGRGTASMDGRRSCMPPAKEA